MFGAFDYEACRHLWGDIDPANSRRLAMKAALVALVKEKGRDTEPRDLAIFRDQQIASLMYSIPPEGSA